MVDSDLYGAVDAYDAAGTENAWVQTANAVPMDSAEFVAITFETRYRCWDNGTSDGTEKCFVEISRDGTTWPDLTSTYVTTWAEEGLVVTVIRRFRCRYEVFPDSETGFETDNPSLIEIDITEAAGSQEQIWVRFRWVGTWGYSWEIDDINIVDIEENDTRIDGYVSYTNYFQTGIYENGAWAQSQLLDTILQEPRCTTLATHPRPPRVGRHGERNHIHLRHGVDIPECGCGHARSGLLCRRVGNLHVGLRPLGCGTRQQPCKQHRVSDV